MAAKRGLQSQLGGFLGKRGLAYHLQIPGFPSLSGLVSVKGRLSRILSEATSCSAVLECSI